MPKTLQQRPYFVTWQITYEITTDPASPPAIQHHYVHAVSQRRALSAFWLHLAINLPDTLKVEIQGVKEKTP